MISQNEYFDGNVRSLGSGDEQGKFTVGVIAPGEWTFGTSSPERMQLVRGSWDVKLPAENGDWVRYEAGSAFDVEAGVSFTVMTSEPVAYICSYE